ncbi:MAG: hypothetical protein AAF702_11840 [Chloroflexota bacterium]
MFGNKGDSGEFRKLDILARIFMGDTWMMVRMLTTIVLWFIGWMITGVELALRWGHGSRYINSLKLVLGFVAMNLAIMVGVILATLQGYEMAGALWPVVNLIYIPLAVKRRLSANRRLHDQGVPGVEDGQNSEFMGLSYLFRLGKRFKRMQNIRFVYRWAEPGLCLLLAFIVDAVDPGVALWLWFCAPALFLNNTLALRSAFYQIQDAVDVQVQGEFVMERVGEPMREAESGTGQRGFTVHTPDQSG